MEMLAEYPAANRLWIDPVTFSARTRETPLNFRSDEQNLKKKIQLQMFRVLVGFFSVQNLLCKWRKGAKRKGGGCKIPIPWLSFWIDR